MSPTELASLGQEGPGLSSTGLQRRVGTVQSHQLSGFLLTGPASLSENQDIVCLSLATLQPPSSWVMMWHWPLSSQSSRIKIQLG